MGRQRTHALVLSLVSGGFLGVVGVLWELVMAYWVGWASHVVLDMVSGGLPFWWPWRVGPEHRVRLVSCRIAGAVDYFIRLVCLSGFVMVAWQEQWISTWAEMMNATIVEERPHD